VNVAQPADCLSCLFVIGDVGKLQKL